MDLFIALIGDKRLLARSYVSAKGGDWDGLYRPEDAGDGGTVDVMSTFVIGEEAFGCVKLNNKSVRMIIKRHGSAGASDPLDQFATVGYKIHGFVAKYLDSSSKRVINLRSSSVLGTNV